MEGLAARLRSISPNRNRGTLSQLKEACDAVTADLARRKWMELESERQRARADALQESLTSMQLQGAQLSTTVQRLEAELQQREQQLAGVLQSEASNARLQAEHEQQGKTLLKLQQELEQVQQLLQQQSKAAATNKASATAAWDKFEGLVSQLLVLVVKAAGALEALNKSMGSRQGCSCCKPGLAQAVDVLHAVVSLRHAILQDVKPTQPQEQQPASTKGRMPQLQPAAGAATLAALQCVGREPQALQAFVQRSLAALMQAQPQQQGASTAAGRHTLARALRADRAAGTAGRPHATLSRSRRAGADTTRAAAAKASPAVAFGRSLPSELCRLRVGPVQAGIGSCRRALDGGGAAGLQMMQRAHSAPLDALDGAEQQLLQQQQPQQQQEQESPLLDSQQQQLIEAAFLGRVAAAWQQEVVQQQQQVQPRPLSPRQQQPQLAPCMDVAPARGGAVQAAYQQHFANPLWAEWSNPNF